jgi:hypothetical protein
MNNGNMRQESGIKKEYDFSAAEQGKFYCKPEHMKISERILTVSETKKKGSKNF